MSALEQLLEDARLAVDTLNYCAGRQDAKGHAESSAQ